MPQREFTYDDAWNLLRIVEANSACRSFSVTVGNFSLEIERESTPVAASVQLETTDPGTGRPQTATTTTEPSEPSPVDSPHASDGDEQEVRSTLAGVFYHAPEPGAEPFTAVGQSVKAGDPIGIIEMMKLMNTVTAPVSGVVIAILADDSQPVEFKQPLFRLRIDEES